MFLLSPFSFEFAAHSSAPIIRVCVCSTDVVPAPQNLRFSEVTQTSFKVHWEHGAPDVALYRIGWSKKGDTEPKYVREHRRMLVRTHAWSLRVTQKGSLVGDGQ